MSIFWDFNLPNATTWFYFSFLLAVSLFFKFGRLLIIRNGDILTLFLLAPGFMLIQASRAQPAPGGEHPAARAAALLGQCGQTASAVTLVAPVATFSEAPTENQQQRWWNWLGYVWLLVGSAYLVFRCLLDLALVQRPALAPNLTFGGLAWLAGALMMCLVAVAFRSQERTGESDPNLSPGIRSLDLAGGPQSASVDMIRTWFRLPPWMMRGLAVACHMAVVLGLILVGWRHFGDATSGMAAATFYLMLPYTGMFVGQFTHIWPTAFLVWAIVVYRFPTLAGSLLGIAAGTFYFPALLIPLWASFYRGRGLGRFLVAFFVLLAISLGIVAIYLWTENDLERAISDVLHQSAWQPWKAAHGEGFWTGLHSAYRLPVFILFMAFVCATSFWPSTKNLGHVLALTVTLLLGLQFWFADRGGIYALWYLPIFLLLVFRPNLQGRLPPPIDPEKDWLARSFRLVGRGLRWVLRIPPPPPPVSTREAIAIRP